MLLVAGTIVTVTAGNGITTVTVEHPYIDPISIGLPAVDPDEEEDGDEPDEDAGEGKDEPTPVALKPEPACDVSEDVRTLARERVASAFNEQQAALEELRARHRHEKAHKALEQAGEMMREIADKADRALAEMCGDVQTVAGRAVAAMETVISLARSAATVTPSPKPTEKPKATEKPRTAAKTTPKPSRTPSCDDRLYESKLKMAAAFEKYHAMHDKMYFAYKRTDSPIAKIVIANDELMHRTYDESKHAILSSGCAGDMGAAVAARAAATFERAYQSSAQAVASQGR